MTITERLDAIKERLVTDPIVEAFEITRERITLVDAHLRVRLVLADDSQLEFSEYMQYSRASGEIEAITYSYHWADANKALIKRWDNAPHFPDMPGFPHHVHDGVAGAVKPNQPMNIFAVLDGIGDALRAGPVE
jgi:hypothetical protein